MQKEIPIPDWKDAELDNPKNWDKYIGFIWANIFVRCNLPKDGIFVEIAPGVAEKIGRGLELYGFKGKIYIVEPEELCLRTIVEKYRQHIPGCEVIPIQKTLEECEDFLPKKVDAIIANHPLDDMILGNSLNKLQFVDYFGEKFGTSIEKTRFLWNKLEEDKELIEEIKAKIVKSWKKIIKKTKPGFVGISQYKSYYFTKNGIFAPDRNALDVLMRIRKEFANYDNKRIIENIGAFNADMMHWVVLENPK